MLLFELSCRDGSAGRAQIIPPKLTLQKPICGGSELPVIPDLGDLEPFSGHERHLHILCDIHTFT